MSESTMRTVVGDRSINEVISSREEIALAAKEMLQKEMDNSQAGISIVNIEMKKTNVPEPVQASFNEVNQAIQEKEQTIYKAREEYNKAVPLARGEAKRLILDAEGYAIDRVNRAQGDATKFKAVYDAYAQAKEVTKKRMYLEAMLEVIPQLGSKYIIDSDIWRSKDFTFFTLKRKARGSERLYWTIQGITATFKSPVSMSEDSCLGVAADDLYLSLLP